MLQVGTGDIARDQWFLQHSDATPFTVRTVYLGSLPGGGQSEWMLPKSSGTSEPAASV